MQDATWITCPGCSGEIGVPADWPAEVVSCPKCAAIVRMDERMRVLWRPKSGAATPDGAISPARWIVCHGCDGEIGVPDHWSGPTIACPKCGGIVAMRETRTVLWRPAVEEVEQTRPIERRQQPRDAGVRQTGEWKRPAGIVALTLGVLGFLASAIVQGRGDFGVGLMAGLLNPLFFVGVPLGVYWLRALDNARHSNRDPPRVRAESRENTNPAAKITAPTFLTALVYTARCLFAGLLVAAAVGALTGDAAAALFAGYSAFVLIGIAGVLWLSRQR